MAGPALVLMKLAMGRYPAVDVSVSFDILSEVLKYFYSRGDAISYLATTKSAPTDQSNAVYVASLDISDSYITILLVRGDPGRSFQGLVNPENRIIKPGTIDEPGFVPGASCHIVIAKNPISVGKDQGRVRMAVQRTHGLGRGLARDFVGQLLHRFADEHPDRFTAIKKPRTKKESPSPVRYRPTVRFHPQENGSLKRDLESGNIGGFKLVRGTTAFQGDASEAQVRKLDVSLQVRIAPTNEYSRVKKLVDHVQQTLQTVSFEALNLELVDDSGNRIDGTRSIDLEDLDKDDLRYCKIVPIPDIDPSLAECHDSIHDPIKQFAVGCISNDKYWN